MRIRQLQHRFTILGLALCFLFPALRPARAQRIYAAQKGADIFVFGGYTYDKPDYGPDYVTNNGVSLGADFTRYFGWKISPSLELRYTNVSGPVVKESTISGGFRGLVDLKQRFHPYIDILGGAGTITYVQPPIPGYPPDHGFVLSYGAGVDIDIYRTFQLKADFQQQSWNLGQNYVTVPSGANYTLSPIAITLGVSYRIPFHSYVGPQNRKYKEPKVAPTPPPAPTPAPVVEQSTSTTTTTTTTTTTPTPTDQPASLPQPETTAPAPTDATAAPPATSTP